MLQICYFHVQFSKPVGNIQGLFKHFQRPISAICFQALSQALHF